MLSVEFDTSIEVVKDTEYSLGFQQSLGGQLIDEYPLKSTGYIIGAVPSLDSPGTFITKTTDINLVNTGLSTATNLWVTWTMPPSSTEFANYDGMHMITGAGTYTNDSEYKLPIPSLAPKAKFMFRGYLQLREHPVGTKADILVTITAEDRDHNSKAYLNFTFKITWK